MSAILFLSSGIIGNRNIRCNQLRTLRASDFKTEFAITSHGLGDKSLASPLLMESMDTENKRYGQFGIRVET
ncbi:hypothetical protein GHT06_014801 [Daphnia sinensis]|uniref:Uncharacterized protein n=1 Tax=Daphnia sinensis TaxID=1820382 RepID=A0AAD5LHY8_9CRUS|nr:hypothetical protein GHT06_014801 [Daphnia sinensis]